MASGRPGLALRQLRNLFSAGTAIGLTDRELLDRFQTRRVESAEAATAAEMAFAALVDRHGAMVWGVCRRVLRDIHEAEDAFQATFLILVRKADSVRVEGSLGRWLYGVAHRVAHRARNRAVRRAARVTQSSSSAPADPAQESELEDLRNVLDQELDRLPPKYRCPVELCHLQGLTYDEAARQLNWPVATVKSRLTRGRLRLRERLVRRGLAPGAVAAADSIHERSTFGRSSITRSWHGPKCEYECHRSGSGGGHRSRGRGTEDDGMGETQAGHCRRFCGCRIRLHGPGAFATGADPGETGYASAPVGTGSSRSTERKDSGRSPLGPEPAQWSDHRDHRGFLDSHRS